MLIVASQQQHSIESHEIKANILLYTRLTIRYIYKLDSQRDRENNSRDHVVITIIIIFLSLRDGI